MLLVVGWSTETAAAEPEGLELEPPGLLQEAGGTSPGGASRATSRYRGNVAAEIATGFGIFLVGAVPGSLYTWAQLESDSCTSGFCVASALSVAAIGGAAGSGLGVYLGGNATGGNGKAGWSVLGSLLGGVAGLGLSAIGGLPGLVIGGLFLLPAGSITGGIVGYRNSAEPPSGGALRLQPYIGGVGQSGQTVGVTVQF